VRSWRAGSGAGQEPDLVVGHRDNLWIVIDLIDALRAHLHRAGSRQGRRL
jgi:hypothetical protein